MARESIKIGRYPNDPDADEAHEAFERVNRMMRDIYPQLDATAEGIEPYATKADMDAVSPGSGDPKIAIVFNDSTAANNGYYRYDSGSWVKRDEFYATELNPSDESEAVTGKAVADYTGENLWPDPHFQETEFKEKAYSVERWGNASNFTLTTPDSTFSSKKIKVGTIDNGNTRVYLGFGLNKLGIEVGDVLRFDVFAQSEAGGKARLSIEFLDNNDDRINLNYSNRIDSISARTRINLKQIVPSAAVSVNLGFERLNTSGAIFYDTFIITKGDITVPDPPKKIGRANSTKIDPSDNISVPTNKAVADFTGENLWPDPHFQQIEYNELLFSLIEWGGDIDQASFTSTDDFGAKKLVLDSGNTDDLFLGLGFDIKSLGFEEGEYLNFITYAESQASIRISIAFYDDSDSRIGSIYYGPTFSELTMSKRVEHRATVPSSAVKIIAGIERLGGVNTPLYIDTLMIAKSSIPEEKKKKDRFDAPLEEKRISKATKLENRAIRKREVPDLITGVRDYQKYPNNIYSIIRGEGDAVEPTNLYKKDFTNFWCQDSYSYKFKSQASGGNLGVDGRWSFDPPIDPPKFQRIGAWVFVPEPSKIDQTLSYIQINLVDANDNLIIKRHISLKNLQPGWNVCSEEATIFEQGYISRVRLLLYTNSPTEINIGHIFYEHGGKAKILIIDDHGYKGFRDYAYYPDLVPLNIPVTWALQPGQYEQGTVDPEKLDESDIMELAKEAHSSFSMHYYRGPNTKPTSDMTAWELREDTQRCIRWLRRKGLIDRYVWRAAFLQNNAPEHEAVRDLVVASRSGSQSTGSVVKSFPFSKTPYDLSSYLIHGRSQSSVDTQFEALKRTRSLAIVYTHDITPTGNAIHMSEPEWDYYASKLQTGISEGWLEGVTMDQLAAGNPRNLSVTSHPDFIRATSI